MTRTIIDSHAHTFVVGYQDTPEGHDALALARHLAEPIGARIVAVVVYDKSLVLPEGEAYWEQELEDKARRMLESLEGVERHAVSARSAPAGILAVAESQEAEMIVLGASSRGLLGRILLGSTSRPVLEQATCPVAIAPRGYSADVAVVPLAGSSVSPVASTALKETR